MMPGTEGGVTKYFRNGQGEQMSIFDAAMKYAETSTPLVILAGHDTGQVHRGLGSKRHAFVRRESGDRGKF